MKLNKIASVTTLVLAAAAASAPAQATWGWHDKGCGSDGNTGESCHASEYFSGIEHNKFYELAYGTSNVEVDGVKINASAYSDTGGHEYIGNKSGYNVYGDVYVESAHINGYNGVTNIDENGSAPEHSADNKQRLSKEGNWWSGYYYNDDTDFDYILISFDEEVNVNGATFSWLWNERDTQVSVAALSDTSMLTSGVNTWADIAHDAVSVGSFDVLNCEDTDLAMVEMESVYSQYWIIGAYNTVFGDIGHDMYNDGFKLASVGFTKKKGGTPPPPSEVTEPGTFAMLFMGGALAMWRRKRTA